MPTRETELASDAHIAVVIPCYRVTRHVEGVIASIGPEVRTIVCVDDACPDGSGDYIEAHVDDPRVCVERHAENQGVGGATMTGMRVALARGADVIVKLDGDGQMDPSLLPFFVAPILAGEADYTKGNRFFSVEDVAAMPVVRLLGNAGLSFLSKLSSGYWRTFDPNNGYVAIHAAVAARLPFHKIARRYFFEADLLFRLNTLQAVVLDVPMQAVYEDEQSNLSPLRELFRHAAGHARNFAKRLFYSYFLRSFSVASVELPLGIALVVFGIVYGLMNWTVDADGAPATAGTVMLAGLPVIVGVQLLLSFLAYDVASSPRWPIHKRLRSFTRAALADGKAAGEATSTAPSDDRASRAEGARKPA